MAIEENKALVPDVQYDLLDAIAEGDRVAVRYTMHDTHQGELLGIAPTGKAVSLPITTVYRISDGQIVDLWENDDTLRLFQQLGAMPPLGQAAQEG